MKRLLVWLAMVLLPGAVSGEAIATGDGATIGYSEWALPQETPQRASGRWHDVLRGQQPDAKDSEEDEMETDRPDFTESSTVVGRGRLQIESGYLYVHDKSGGVVSDEHVLPELLVRYGLTDNFELRFEWEGYLFSRQSSPLLGSSGTDNGSVDIVVGFKAKLTEQHAWFPETAVITSLALPTGKDMAHTWSPIFTSDQMDPAINFCYGWNLGEKVTLAGSTGAWWTTERGDHFTQVHQSLTTSYSFTDKFNVFFEWFMLSFQDAADHKPEHYLHTGPVYQITPNIQLDGHVGFGLTEAADDLFAGCGCSFRF